MAHRQSSLIVWLALGAYILASTIAADTRVPKEEDVRSSRSPALSGYLTSAPAAGYFPPPIAYPESRRLRKHYLASLPPQGHHSEDSTPYSYEYNVHDDYKGTHFGHKEAGGDNVANGEYYVHLPDGRIQTVTYYTDEDGFHPDIVYDETGGLGKSLHRGENGRAHASSSKSVIPQHRFGGRRKSSRTSPTSRSKGRQHSRYSGPVKIVKRVRGPISRKDFEDLESMTRRVVPTDLIRGHKYVTPATASTKGHSRVVTEPSYLDRVPSIDGSQGQVYEPEDIYTDLSPNFETGKTVPENSRPIAKAISHSVKIRPQGTEPKIEVPSSAYGLPDDSYEISEETPSAAYGLPDVTYESVEPPPPAYTLPEITYESTRAPSSPYDLPKAHHKAVETPTSLYGLPHADHGVVEAPPSLYGLSQPAHGVVKTPSSNYGLPQAAHGVVEAPSSLYGFPKAVHNAARAPSSLYGLPGDTPASSYDLPEVSPKASKSNHKASDRTLQITKPYSGDTEIINIDDLDLSDVPTETRPHLIFPIQDAEEDEEEEELPIDFDTDINFNIADTLFRTAVETSFKEKKNRNR